jgi:hypothetical protein
MSLLADLPLIILRQDPRRMMKRAYQIFSGVGRRADEGVHLVPYELLRRLGERRGAEHGVRL